MSEQPEICLELRSNPCYLCGTRELVAQVARRVGFPDAQCAQWASAVDEALANVINHGYERRPDGPIWLRLYVLDDTDEGAGLRIIIEDEARQVDPASIKGRDLDDIRPGGLGVHIIREYMDQVAYQMRERAGMRLTLTKRVHGPASKRSIGTEPPSHDCDKPRAGAPLSPP